MSDPTELDVPDMDLADIAQEASRCTACELHLHANQTVFGAGALRAPLMLLGEQPGDREDLAGLPFVGPAGRELDRALQAASIERSDVYITNVVKHFRFEQRGKKRLHKKPTRAHIAACRPWLDAEIEKVDPGVIVCLGGSAAQALLGSDIRIMESHGVAIEWEGLMVVPTIHPSYVLRSGDDERRHELFELLVGDLCVAAEIGRPPR